MIKNLVLLTLNITFLIKRIKNEYIKKMLKNL